MTLRQRINALRDLPERLDFHPEGATGVHIAFVAVRAMLAGATAGRVNRSLILTALLHDLCKGLTGVMSAAGGWSNPDHPRQAANLLLADDDLRHLVHTFGDVPMVEQMVRHHMDAKHGPTPRVLRHNPLAQVFPALDDMVGRHAFPTVGRVRVDGHPGHVFHANRNPLNTMHDRPVFTVSFHEDRFPRDFEFDWKNPAGFIEQMAGRIDGCEWVVDALD